MGSVLVQLVLEPENGLILLVSKGAKRCLGELSPARRQFFSLFTSVSHAVPWSDLVQKLFSGREDSVYFTGRLVEDTKWKWKDVYVALQLFDCGLGRELVATIWSREESVETSPRSEVTGIVDGVPEKVFATFPLSEETRVKVEEKLLPAFSMQGDGSGVGLAMFSTMDCKLEWCNETFAQLIGLSQEEVLRRTIQDVLYSGEDKAVWQCDTKLGPSHLRVSFLRNKSDPAVLVHAEDICEISEKNQKVSPHAPYRTLEHIPAGVLYVCRVGGDEEKFYMNSELERITGASRLQITSLDAWFSLLQPEAPEEFRRIYESKTNNGSSWSGGWLIPFRRGEKLSHWLDLRVSVYGNEQVWLVTDVTEHVLEKEKFRLFFELSPDACLICDMNHVITECNVAAVRLLRYRDKAGIINKKPEDLSPEFQLNEKRSSDYAKEILEFAKEKGFLQCDWLYSTADGEIVHVSLSLTSTVDLGPRGVVLVAKRQDS